MFLGLEWYWWLLIVVAAAIIIPVKIKFVKKWSERQKDQKNKTGDKWGDDQ